MLPQRPCPAGALCASLLLVAWMGSQHTQQLMMLVSMLAAVAALGSASSVRRIGLAGVLALIFMFALDGWFAAGVRPVPGLLIAYGRFTATVLGQAGDILYAGEGLHSSIAVSRLPNGRLGYHNAGKIQASSQPLILDALADPVRRSIIRQLAARPEWSISCGSFDLPVSKATSSHHFAVLRDHHDRRGKVMD